MFITILADASFCPDTKVGGFGCWVAGSRGKRSFQGMLNGFIDNNNCAEMMAVVNALFLARKNLLVDVGDRVLIQTDCTAAIMAFIGSRQPSTAQEQTVVEWYRRIQVESELKITLKHVKGHSKRNEGRFVSNNICDKQAKQEMQRARNLLKLNEIRNRTGL